MIIDLPGTSTSTVLRRLYELREAGGAVTLGRVLTLVVGVDEGWSTEESIEAANEASREHPCRVIVVTLAPEDTRAPSRLDAQIRVGADAGASEVILLRLAGVRISGRQARLALIWALAAVAPVMLLAGLVQGFLGEGPGLTLVHAVAGLSFIAFWVAGLRALSGRELRT